MRAQRARLLAVITSFNEHDKPHEQKQVTLDEEKLAGVWWAHSPVDFFIALLRVLRTFGPTIDGTTVSILRYDTESTLKRREGITRFFYTVGRRRLMAVGIKSKGYSALKRAPLLAVPPDSPMGVPSARQHAAPLIVPSSFNATAFIPPPTSATVVIG